MKKCNFESMTVQEFNSWISSPKAKNASLPEFFEYGVDRTRNVLKGTAQERSVKKRKSFIARHGAQYCKNPTARRRIAIKNWGYNVKKLPNEKNNIK